MNDRFANENHVRATTRPFLATAGSYETASTRSQARRLHRETAEPTNSPSIQSRLPVARASAVGVQSFMQEIGTTAPRAEELHSQGMRMRLALETVDAPTNSSGCTERWFGRCSYPLPEPDGRYIHAASKRRLTPSAHHAVAHGGRAEPTRPITYARSKDRAELYGGYSYSCGYPLIGKRLLDAMQLPRASNRLATGQAIVSVTGPMRFTV